MLAFHRAVVSNVAFLTCGYRLLFAEIANELWGGHLFRSERWKLCLLVAGAVIRGGDINEYWICLGCSAWVYMKGIGDGFIKGDVTLAVIGVGAHLGLGSRACKWYGISKNGQKSSIISL